MDMRLYWLFAILNIILIIDWAKNKRPIPWLFALVLLGPLGGMAYVIYYYEQINFPIKLAQTIRGLTQKPIAKPCPRCGVVAELKQHQDGRQMHFMCQQCIEMTFLEPLDVNDVLDAASTIIRARDEARDSDSQNPE